MISKLEWLELRRQNKRILDELADLRQRLSGEKPPIPNKEVSFPITSVVTVLPRIKMGKIISGRLGVELNLLAGSVGKVMKVTIEPYEKKPEPEQEKLKAVA